MGKDATAPSPSAPIWGSLLVGNLAAPCALMQARGSPETVPLHGGSFSFLDHVVLHHMLRAVLHSTHPTLAVLQNSVLFERLVPSSFTFAPCAQAPLEVGCTQARSSNTPRDSLLHNCHRNCLHVSFTHALGISPLCNLSSPLTPRGIALAFGLGFATILSCSCMFTSGSGTGPPLA